MVRSRVQSSIVARRWSAEEDALLAQLFREGKDLDEIAVRLKRTIASVQRRVSDLRAHSAIRDCASSRRNTDTEMARIPAQSRVDSRRYRVARAVTSGRQGLSSNRAEDEAILPDRPPLRQEGAAA